MQVELFKFCNGLSVLPHPTPLCLPTPSFCNENSHLQLKEQRNINEAFGFTKFCDINTKFCFSALFSTVGGFSLTAPIASLWASHHLFTWALKISSLTSRTIRLSGLKWQFLCLDHKSQCDPLRLSSFQTQHSWHLLLKAVTEHLKKSNTLFKATVSVWKLFLWKPSNTWIYLTPPSLVFCQSLQTNVELKLVYELCYLLTVLNFFST